MCGSGGVFESCTIYLHDGRANRGCRRGIASLVGAAVLALSCIQCVDEQRLSPKDSDILTCTAVFAFGDGVSWWVHMRAGFLHLACLGIPVWQEHLFASVRLRFFTMYILQKNDNLCKYCVYLMYHAACKVEFQPFTRSYSQLTFFNFL